MTSQNMGIISGSSGGVCLICNGSIKKVKISSTANYPSSSPLLSRDLYVYFVMRHVLEVPLQHLNRFMVQCPNIIDWVEICDSCNENDVEKCKNLFLELVEVKKKFNAAKLQVAEKIQKSMSERGRVDKRVKQVETICNVARQYVLRRIKQGHHQTDPSRNGDLLAHDKASKPAVQSCSKSTPSSHPTSFPVESQLIRGKADEDDPQIPLDDDQDDADFGLKLEPMSPVKTDHQENQDSKLADYFDGNYDPISENTLEDPDWDQDSIDPSSPASTNNIDSNDEEDDWVPKTRKGKNARRKISNKSHKSKKEESIPSRNDLPPENIRTRRRPGQRIKLSEKQKTWLTCQDCGWRTKYSLLLKHHKKQVHGDGKMEEIPHSTSNPGTSSSKDIVTVNKTDALNQCDQCGKEFTTSAYLLYHLGSIHGLKGSQKYTCTFPNCGKVFYTKSYMKKHETIHKPPQYKCDLCGICFKTKPSFTMHMNGHEGTIEYPFKCDLCQAGFHYKSYLNIHMKTCRSSGTPRKYRWKEEGKLKCSLCDFKAFRPSRVKVHLAKKHGGSGEIIYPENNPLQNQKKMYVCELCGWKTTLVKFLRKHKKEAHGIVEAFICKVEGCGKSFEDKVLLSEHEYSHQNDIHGTVEPFLCQLEGCGKSFPNSGLLKKHEYSHRRKFRCQKCRELFASKSDLKAHLKVKCERREKVSKSAPPLCNICGNLFSNKAALKVHIDRVHERKLEVCCELCGKIIIHKYSLEGHMAAVHKIGKPELQCKVEGCSKMFGTKQKFDEHMKTHAEARSFLECEHCGKKLMSKNSLGNHIRAIHRNRDSKPAKCEVCGKGFATKSYLWQHMRVHKKN